MRDKQHSCGRRDRLRGPDRAAEWSGFGTRTRGDPSSAGRESPSGRRDPPRFHNASTTSFDTCPSADAMTNIPLRKRRRGDGRCPARTGDLLLVRREHLLRSTAVCRSNRSASDKPHSSCCVLLRFAASKPLPDALQPRESAGAFTREGHSRGRPTRLPLAWGRSTLDVAHDQLIDFHGDDPE